MTEIVNDLDNLPPDELELLKQKLGKKMPVTIVETRKRSMNFGIVGTGQAGSRVAEKFHELGYETVVFNTAQQDLAHIKLPEERKLLLQYGLGGAAKELDIGREAAESHRNEINDLITKHLEDSHVNILCLSLGGGSGAGSVDTMIEVLQAQGKPIVVIAVLPMDSDDGQTKSNSLETLAKIAKHIQDRRVQSIIVVDNAKIESIYSEVSQLKFFELANEVIVEPIDKFNTLSAEDSPVKALDSTEWAKLLIDGEGLTIFGSLVVTNYEDETSIAEAVLNNLSNNLLAEGFDLTQAKYAGWIVAANEKVLEKIPQRALTFANSLVQEKVPGTKTVFRGVYVTNDVDDDVKVYSCFSGLGLPTSRLDALKKEVASSFAQAKSKDETRNLSLHLDTGKNSTVSEAQKVKDKIVAKNSSFGKFMGRVTDKRK
jgi:cell division GTPase FtsZ